MDKKYIIIGIVVCLVIAASLSLLFQKEDIINEEKVYSVEIVTAVPENMDQFLDYAAVVKNQDLEEVIFPTVATIKKIHVQEGETVTAGQLLVELEDDNASAQVDIARRNMNNAFAAMNAANEELTASQKNYDAIEEDLINDQEYIRLKKEHDEALAARNKAQEELDSANSIIEDQKELLEKYNANLEEKKQKENEAKEKVVDLEKEVAANPTDEGLKQELNLAKSALSVATNERESAETQVKQQEKILSETTTKQNIPQKEASLAATNSNYQVAKVAYDRKVLENEAALREAESEVRVAQTAYDNAQSAYEASVIAYNNANDSLDNLKYYAKSNGIVLTIVSNEGSVATPIAPVLVVGTVDMIAEFGVAAEDIKKIKVSSQAIIVRGEEKYTGEVIKIDVVPDEVSRTYLTDVLINTKGHDFLIGELVSLKIFIGDTIGVSLPINAILNDGTDYIYVVEDNRAVRRDVILGEINNNTVKVEGLQPGDKIIVKGMKNVKSGYKVLVKNND